MTTTPNLLIEHVVASQNNKSVTQNEANDFLDRALTDLLSKAMADSDQTLTATAGGEALAHMVYFFTGALSADRDVIVPTNTKLYICRNDTTGGFDVTVKTAAGSGIALGPGQKALLYCDGTDVIDITFGLVAPSVASGTEAMANFLEVPAAKTYVLDQSAKFPYDIIDVTHELGSGTSMDFSIEIDGVPVTGLTTVSTTTTEATTAATAANSVPVGGKVTLILASLVGSPADWGFTIELTRTG